VFPDCLLITVYQCTLPRLLPHPCQSLGVVMGKHAQLLLSHTQPIASAHCHVSRCPSLAAAAHISSSHRQPCSRAHCNTARCPTSAAYAAFAFHAQPISRAHCSRIPRALQPGARPQQRGNKVILPVPGCGGGGQCGTSHEHPFAFAQASRSADVQNARSRTLALFGKRWRPEASTADSHGRPPARAGCAPWGPAARAPPS
jgi:hypothetical protein